jgi:hypothetical protein
MRLPVSSVCWSAAAHIVVHGATPWRWEGTLVDCLNVWRRLDAGPQQRCDIFLDGPVSGVSIIGPAAIRRYIARDDFPRA